MDAAKLKTFLQCPVCQYLPPSTILSCVNRHKICESCFSKLNGEESEKLCREGGFDYDRPPRREKDFEAIIDNSDFKLMCTRPGCQLEMMKNQLKDYEVKCVCSLVPCPQTLCPLMISFNSLDKHLKEHTSSLTCSQPVAVADLNEEIIDYKNNYWVLFSHEQNGVQFYPQFVKRNDLLYFWVKAKGDLVEAACWQFHDKSSNGESNLAVKVTGLVDPINMTVEESCETGQYLLMTRQAVEKLKVDVLEELASDLFYSSIEASFAITGK